MAVTAASRSPSGLTYLCRKGTERGTAATRLSSEGGRVSRRAELSRELFGGCKGVRELRDGYEFVFPGGKEWIERLARFVAEERECCRFFAFELLFEPDQGPVSLRMRGPEGTKEFLVGQFTEGFAGEHTLKLD